ncbi:MAG: hypothetical protein UT00_C0024G0005 [Parcubacteria group bacterium GW2011_GWA1_38_7]|nr:MAG: hypothetical protein UT00_C0024G0005 [Parcubacteria group bacterium GW2011_GWA1_38_7]
MKIINLVKKVFKVGLFSTEAAVRLAYFLLASVVIISVTYLFGYHILVGTLKGGDGGYAEHNVEWYGKYSPRVPFWYPVQGGGFALTLSYSLAPTLLANTISTWKDLTPVQSLRLVVFGSYLLGAFGVYFLSSLRLKNQTVGLLGAVGYLLIPATWFWILKLGYYGFVAGIGFIPWVFLVFD